MTETGGKGGKKKRRKEGEVIGCYGDYPREYTWVGLQGVGRGVAGFAEMAAKDVHDDYPLKDYKYRYCSDLLAEKVAFVSGGGSGIGFRIAELLMRHGCNVAIGSRRIDKLEQSAKDLTKATGRQCLPIQIDVRKFDTVLKAMKQTLDTFGSIDILINSAAGNFLCPVSSMSSNAFKTVLEIDTMGTFNCCKAAFDTYMKDHGGCIVNISATLYFKGDAYQAHAGSAKAAIDALTRHLAVEWGPLNIRINSVLPGPIEGTEGFRKLGGAVEGAVEFLESSIPLGRSGTRTEIAEACLFLSSPLSSFVTGSLLVVDGGSWMTSGSANFMSKL